MFNINPATAAKGLNILADEGILYKKRGLGMFASPSAKEMILTKRKECKLSKIYANHTAANNRGPPLSGFFL